MATYRFEQFNVEIVNPKIDVNVDSLGVQPSKNTISVDITLVTDSARFGVALDNISVINLNYEGEENLLERVTERLNDFAI
jgi:hypothetical protein